MKRKKLTDAQILLATHLEELGFHTVFEFAFCHRKWAFDVACPDIRVGFECNGGRWTGGHFRGKAVDEEYEKLNVAQIMGWRVIQFTNEFVLSGKAQEFIKQWKTEETNDVSRKAG